jgi:hypothetical protein
MQSHNLEIANRILISAVDLEDNFDSGLQDFKALLHSINGADKDRLVDLLEILTTEIAAARR